MNPKNKIAINKLKGQGVELGAMHSPIEYDQSKASVLYADRLTKEQAIKAFPELGESANNIVNTDITTDLNNDKLEFIKNKNLDFVIANHVIEHLVNPIRFLRSIERNLKTDGLFLLTVPNKEHTHDVKRELTRFRHLLFDYFLRTKKLSNSHIKDYLKNKSKVEHVHQKTKEYFIKNKLPLSYYKNNKIPLNPISRFRLYKYHRARSIHVHVWNRESFDYFLRRTISMFGLKFSIEEYLPVEDSAGEMIYLIRKTV